MTSTTTNAQTARLTVGDQTVELPVVVGSEQEHGIQVGSLRSDTGYITLDIGYGNTGSAESAITFINGEEGILRYRGIPIEQLAQKASFIETALLLIDGELPTQKRLSHFQGLLEEEQPISDELLQTIALMAKAKGHPMPILSAAINALNSFHPAAASLDSDEAFDRATASLISRIRSIAAAIYKHSRGEDFVPIEKGMNYSAAFLKQMFGDEPDADVVEALERILILHADHEQNCSTSTVRMVGSSGANLFAGCSAGVGALWGPLHGGANAAVLAMLEQMQEQGGGVDRYVERVKNKEVRLMGFGHRVYKSYDPRAKNIKGSADKVLEKLGASGDHPLLELARQLEKVALEDEYFIERNLYPNVDFYSGLIMEAIGIPVDMFTVMFAMGRMPGWVAHWKEQRDSGGRIQRPRQIYTGETERDYVAIADR